MTSPALLPCPFCGGTEIEIRPNNIGDYYAICSATEPEDMSCGASTSDRSCETQEDAVRRWNERAPGLSALREGGGGEDGSSVAGVPPVLKP